jgi:hypothetical protein
MVGSLALVGAVAGLTYTSLNSVGVEFGDLSSSQPSPDATQPTNENSPQANPDLVRFLAPNRDHLAICVHVENGSETTAREAAHALRGAISQLRETPVWMKYDLSNPEPEVSEGCPHESTMRDFLSAPGATAVPFTYFARRIREGSTPSVYRAYVYIVPEHQVARLTEVYGLPLSAEEMLCEGHACAQVTTALYLSPDHLRDSSRVADLMASALGLK